MRFQGLSILHRTRSVHFMRPRCKHDYATISAASISRRRAKIYFVQKRQRATELLSDIKALEQRSDGLVIAVWFFHLHSGLVQHSGIALPTLSWAIARAASGSTRGCRVQ
jgi:hypothetical protein